MTDPSLSCIPLFAELDAAELAEIELQTKLKRYRKQTVIIETGDDSSTLYLLLSGRAKVYVDDSAGKELILQELGPGDHFGELAVLGGSQRTASVMTLTDCAVRSLSGRAFQDLLSSRPRLALHLIKRLAQRVTKLTDQVRDLGLLSSYQRIVKILLEAAESEDGRLITPALTQQSLADRAGCSREMVSRILGDLRTGGYLSQDGKRVVILRKLPQRW
jgi:CRP/FNR family cyclic AMP-dependent transcriptional regulator